MERDSMALKDRITKVEETLQELKEEAMGINECDVVGVQFPLEHVGRMSTKTLFFKGNFPLGTKVRIVDPCPFVVRNYGNTPIGYVVMNGEYARLIAEAEGFKIKDEARKYEEEDVPYENLDEDDLADDEEEDY